MKNLLVFTLAITLVAFISCKKQDDNPTYDVCDSRRKTVMTATNWTGYLGYYNDLRKWAVNVYIPNTTDGIRTCILCTDIPDSLKNLGQVVTFSGDLKASDGSPAPTRGGQEIYYVTPINLHQ